MKHAILPISCSLLLFVFAAAGASHWWSVKEMVKLSENRLPTTSPTRTGRAESPAPPPPPAERSLPTVANTPTPLLQVPIQHASGDTALQKMLELNQKTLEEVKRLSKENRDLRDQMAETNRDLMKLEFRVDTHSESFRPLPASDERGEMTLDVNRLDSNGVLPAIDESLPLPAQ